MNGCNRRWTRASCLVILRVLYFFLFLSHILYSSFYLTFTFTITHFELMWRRQKLVNYKTRRWWMIIYMRRDGQYSIVGCRQRRSRPIDPRYKKNMTRCVWQCLSSAHSSGVPILYGTVPVSWNQFYSTIKCMKPKKDGGRMEQTKFPKWNRRKDDKHKICMISQINLKWRIVSPRCP